MDDISAEEEASQKGAWVPDSDEDQGRKKGSGSQKVEGKA